MDGYSQGKKTKKAEMQLKEWNPDSTIDDEAIKGYWKDSKNFASFPEKIYDFAVIHGCRVSREDVKGLKKFINDGLDRTWKTKDKDIIVNRVKRLSTKTIGNWLTASRPNSGGRENVYQLCFALGLTEAETAEFFMKAYWERPFNFRKPNECVYYYCLKNGRTFREAQDLITSITKATIDIMTGKTDSTEMIERKIEYIEDADSLVRYIAEHPKNFSVSHVAGRKAVIELIEGCKENVNKLINWHKSGKSDFDPVVQGYLDYEGPSESRPLENGIKSNEQLLTAIYYVPTRISDAKNQGFCSEFPDYVRKNFPRNQSLQDIIENNEPLSDDAIRKAIILLYFYQFYTQKRLEEYKSGRFDSDSADFSEEYDNFKLGDEVDEVFIGMNRKLDLCGYGELYPRNPYDWIFLRCASTVEPLAELQAFMGLAYGEEDN